MQKNLLFSLRFTFKISPELFIFISSLPFKNKINYVFSNPPFSGNIRTIKREGKRIQLIIFFFFTYWGMQSARNCAYIIASINHLQLIEVALHSQRERKPNIILGNSI